jgi:hypothetical protein
MVRERGDYSLNARHFESQVFLANQPVDRMLFSPGVHPNLSTRFLDRHARRLLPEGAFRCAPVCWLQDSELVDKALLRDQRP